MDQSSGRTDMRTCEYCEREAARGDLCWAHLKRKRHGKPMSEPIRDAMARPLKLSRRELLRRAAIRFADADCSDEIEYRRADDLLRKYEPPRRKPPPGNVPQHA